MVLLTTTAVSYLIINVMYTRLHSSCIVIIIEQHVIAARVIAMSLIIPSLSGEKDCDCSREHHL